MWSNDRFSIIRTTMWSILARFLSTSLLLVADSSRRPHGSTGDYDATTAVRSSTRTRQCRPKAGMRSSTKPSSQAGSVVRGDAQRAGVRVRLEPELRAQQEQRRSGGPRLRPRRVGHDAGRLVAAPLEAGEELRQPVLEERRGSRAARARRAPPRARRPACARPSAISELSCGQTVPLWYSSGSNAGSSAASVRTPQPGPERSRHELRRQPARCARRERCRSRADGPCSTRARRPAACRASRPSAYQPRSGSQNAASNRSRSVAASRFEPHRRRLVAPHAPRELGHAQLRVVDVALHLDRLRSARARASRRGRPSSCTSPSSSGCRCRGVARRRYSTKPSPSRSPKRVDPVERAPRRMLQLEHDRVVAAPAPQLREQDEEQRRRVDGAVVAVGPDQRGLAAPQLVHDLPGLGVALRIVRLRLRLGERAQRAGGRLGTEQQLLEAT